MNALTSNRTCVIFISLVIFLLSQTCGNELKPEKVHRIIYIAKPNEWYLEQAKLWQAEVQKNPGDPTAWLNYYLANRYANFPKSYDQFSEDKKARLNQIIDDMGKAVPNSYEYNYLRFFNADDKKENLSYIERAYQLQPENPDTYYEFIVYYLLNGEDAKAGEFLEKLYESEDIATGLVNYNYNVLMSTEKNAILFTNGDNDTYPCWMLQAKGVRPDVTVMNVNLIRKKPYLQRLLKEKNIRIDMNDLPDAFSTDFAAGLCKMVSRQYPNIPLYFAATVNPQSTESISDDLYLVGLAFRYSSSRIDNLALLRYNWENNLRLDYLNYDWYSEKYLASEMIEKMLNQNYIPPALLLYEHYKLSGENRKAEQVKDLTLQIAKPAGKENEVLEILMKK